MVKSRLVEQSTNFHSLARDLELKMATCEDDSQGERRMNYDEMENDQGRKHVLLEKTNCLHEEEYSGTRDEGPAQHMLRGPFWKFSTGKQMVKKGALGQKESAFTEVRQMKEKLKMEKAKEMEQGNGGAHFGKGTVQGSSGSAFSFVRPTRATGEPKSAFSKPAKGLVDRRTATASYHLSDSVKDPGKLSGCISATGSMLTSKRLASDLNGSPLLQTSLVQSNPFSDTSGIWLRPMAEHMQAAPTATSSPSSASLTLLPPTFASFGVAAQNWCAKCNLSFRMTSDLVFHMRSHHKKEGVSPEFQGKRRREEKLACPVCQEYFRERHHLSRHMTSHN
ncbi:zinc finger protein 488 [Elgaria multicarinata webbii]|uniref:zinc finger protein 488 n=1 Tax=Elgaria multicarinata webbii TaxID=159646 RepID=UPI002FCD309A